VIISKDAGSSPAIPSTSFDILLAERGATSWTRKISFSDQAYPRETLLEDLTRDGIPEVVLSTTQGSAGVVNYWVYGWHEGEIALLLDRKFVLQGDVATSPIGLRESSGNVVTLYSWDGSSFLGSRIQAPQQPTRDGEVLHYRLEDSPGGRALGPTSVVLRVGQELQLVRDDLTETTERILYSANGVIEDSDRNVWRAAKPGETDITIIPRLYDWDKALVIKVTVQ
jgi:hypothetical protein